MEGTAALLGPHYPNTESKISAQFRDVAAALVPLIPAEKG